MTDGEPTAATTKTSRGRRYPGSSLDDVLAALRHIHAAGGTVSIGRLAVRVGKSEKSSAFERLTATMISFGLVRWQARGSGMLELTDDGRAALSDNEDDRAAALRAAFVRPEVFALVARRFSGRALNEADVTEGFLAAGVAPEASAQIAAKTFIESARTATAAHEEGGRLILDGDLPVEDHEIPTPRQATGTTPARRADPAAPGPVTRRQPTTPEGQPQTFEGATVAPGITLHLDVSGWEVDKVVELVRRLQEPAKGA